MTLYVTCGMSFAGKTTLARAIHYATGIALIEPDALAEEKGWRLTDLGSDALTPAQWREMMAEAFARAGALLAAGRDVLFDTTATSPASRDRFRGLADAHGAALCFVAVEVPRGEAQRRWERNNETRERFTVAWAHFLACAEAWAPPSGDEGGRVIVYHAGQDTGEWIARHFGAS